MRALRRVSWVLDHPAVGVYGTPVVLAVSIYFAATGPEWWSDFFFAHGLEFLITFWIGSGFAFMWWMLQRSSKEVPGGELGVAVIGIVGIVLIAGAGVFTDPALFGVAVWPGLAIGARALSRQVDGRSADSVE